MSSTHPDIGPGTVEVDLGGRLVTVPRGGLYDRYRMNTDLDDVARDPRVSSVDFFCRLPKTKVDSLIGPTLTPNFYYRLSSARLTMLARSRAIRARLPRELAPLEVTPGLGLVSVIFFATTCATSISTPKPLWGSPFNRHATVDSVSSTSLQP